MRPRGRCRCWPARWACCSVEAISSSTRSSGELTGLDSAQQGPGVQSQRVEAGGPRPAGVLDQVRGWPRRPRRTGPGPAASRPASAERRGRRACRAAGRAPATRLRPCRRTRGCGWRPSSTGAGSCAQPDQRVVLRVDDALLHRDDRVVGDLDVLGADLGAALGDVAHAEAVLRLRLALAVPRVERVHVELGEPDEEPRPGEGLLVLLVVADHVAGVLAQEALDALAELLAPLDVDLLHPVLARREVRPAARTPGSRGPSRS